MVRISIALLTLSSFLSSVTAASLGRRTDKGGSGGYTGCTKENTEVRKDWASLDCKTRKAYTDATKCIIHQRSNLDRSTYPGAVNKFEDYAAIHIERSLNIHVSGFFLTWHRLYVHLWYQDLKETCGYDGPMPYWNWPSTADNLQGSEVFDGSECSMSGDGAFTDGGPIVLGPNLTLPPGSGGGCVTSGPFANLEITFAPINISVALSGGPLPANAFDNNPACLTRDLNTYVAQTFDNQALVDAALATPDIASFQAALNGDPLAGGLGLHLGAHFTVGGDAANLFTSPQDPIWYLLHAYLDKLYVDWQAAHPDAAYDVSGTETFQNTPPSDNVTADTSSPDWGYFYPSVSVGSLLDAQGGTPFCYRYE